VLAAGEEEEEEGGDGGGPPTGPAKKRRISGVRATQAAAADAAAAALLQDDEGPAGARPAGDSDGSDAGLRSRRRRSLPASRAVLEARRELEELGTAAPLPEPDNGRARRAVKPRARAVDMVTRIAEHRRRLLAGEKEEESQEQDGSVGPSEGSESDEGLGGFIASSDGSEDEGGGLDAAAAAGGARRRRGGDAAALADFRLANELGAASEPELFRLYLLYLTECALAPSTRAAVAARLKAMTRPGAGAWGDEEDDSGGPGGRDLREFTAYARAVQKIEGAVTHARRAPLPFAAAAASAAAASAAAAGQP
jgi:hypothetical protein